MNKKLQITLFAVVMACGMNLMGSAKDTSPLPNCYGSTIDSSTILSTTRNILKEGLLLTASIYASGSSFNQVGIKKIAALSLLNLVQKNIINKTKNSFVQTFMPYTSNKNKTAPWIAHSLMYGINSAITTYAINGAVDYERFGKIFALHTVQHLI